MANYVLYANANGMYYILCKVSYCLSDAFLSSFRMNDGHRWFHGWGGSLVKLLPT